jgi:heme/copper-type cytochrome/quinol oxidase subunit 2
MKKFFATAMILFFAVTPFAMPAAHGQNLICRVFPFIENIGAFGVNKLCTGLDPQEPVDSARELIQFGLNLVFVGIIVLAIFIIVKAAINYIRSEGDEDKIRSANKSIKAVFTGIIALFVGIIGIILVLAIFNATDAVNQETPDQIEDVFGDQ